MNVIVMGNFLYPEGMAGTKRVQHFIDYLKSHSVSVKILLLRQGGTNISKNKLSGNYKRIWYKTIGNDLRLTPSVFFTLPLYFSQGSLFLINLKRKSTRNILYIYGGPNLENLLFIILAKLLGFKIVCDIVEDHTDFDGSLHVLARIKLIATLLLQTVIHKLSDGLVVISYFLMHKYEQKIRKTIPIRHIPISAKIRKKSVKLRLGTPVKIVYAGSFANKDGVDHLIEAFKAVYQSHKNIIFFLTGKGVTKNINLIKNKIKTLDSIKYLGYLRDNDFYKLLDDSDILCMIRTGSKFANAGFPFKLGEYLATGNPVIASNVGDISCYLENKKDAILVTPGNVKEIQQAIEYLIREPENAMKIGNAGKQKCIEFFDPQKNGKLLLDLFKSI